jgi:hypothetical protein
LAVSSDVAGTYNFEIAAVGTDPNATTHSFLASFTATGGSGPRGFDFAITPASSILSLPAGEPAVFDLEFQPSKGTFPGNVALSNSDNCPPLSTCSLSLSQVSKGSGSTLVTFTIATAAPILARHSARRHGLLIFAFGIPLLGWFGGVTTRSRSKRRLTLAGLSVLVSLLCLQVACGGGLQGNGTKNAQPGTPAGVYTMTITGTMPSLPARTAQVQLTVN